MARTYSPLPGWGPAAWAGAVLLAGYVVGPLVGRALALRTLAHCAEIFDNNLVDFGDHPEGATP